MYERETVIGVAADIIVWQSAAQQLPLPELRAVVTDWQNMLAASLDAFNDLCRDHAAHDECTDATTCTDAIKEAIGEVARQATATAILVLGLSHRAHEAAHKN
jgi:hypothetical protein